MNLLAHYFDQLLESVWAQNIGWSLLHSLWQITLLAALYAAASLALGNRSASLRYLVGCIAMVAMLVAPAMTLCTVPWPSQSTAIATVEPHSIRPNDLNEPTAIVDQQAWDGSGETTAGQIFQPLLQSERRDVAAAADRLSYAQRLSGFVGPWLPVATILWLLGVMLLLLRPLLGCIRVRALRRSGITPLSELHHQLSQRLVKRLGIRYAVQFAQSALIEVPAVIGYIRPMVLLPASAVTGLTTRELELILTHELAHIRRHDYLVNLGQTVVEAFLFYHPAMWWVSCQVRRERENCCDDVAVATSGDRATYIRALAQLEQNRVAVPALSAAGGSLLHRVRRLLGEPQLEFGYRKSSLWLTVLMTAGIAMTVAALAGFPSGQTQAADESTENAEADANEDVQDQEDHLLNFDKIVGQKVASVVRDANLSFVDEQRLAAIEADFAGFVSAIPHGTLLIGTSIPSEQRKAILTAIEKHGGKHLGIAQVRQGDLRSSNLAYLSLPDRLLTLKWKLCLAILHARTLNAESQLKLDAQRSWMRQHIESLPEYKAFTHEMALSGLEERFADPLCCTLSYPMTDEQFERFRNQLDAYKSKESEVAFVVAHIVQQSMDSQYRDFGDFTMPFADHVVSYGAGRIVHLGFESNRSFVSSLRSIHEIESSGTVIDATNGYLVTAPKESREPGNFQRWLLEQGKGDFGFDDARGGGLFAVRGAKLVKLNVGTWFEADAISNDEMRTLLEGPTASRTVSLKEHYLDYQQDNGAPYCYVGVLTQEGRIAVVAVEDFSGPSRIGVRTRVRSVLPPMVTEELFDDAATLFFDRPSHWVDRNITVNGEELFVREFRQPVAEANGVFPSIKVEVHDDKAPFAVDVIAYPDRTATVNQVLTVAGEPARLIAFRLPDQSATSEWMRLSFCKGARGYELTFAFPAAKRKQYVELAQAIAKSIRIEANRHPAEDVSERREGVEFLAGIPEFADLRIGMSEEQLNQVIAHRMLQVQKNSASDNRRTYTLTTPEGDAIMVMFQDGKCSGIQRSRRSNSPDQKHSDWGDATDGVQLRIHSLDVLRDQQRWKIVLKTDIRASDERTLPHYGAPVDEYMIEWNGKWYREVDRGANVAASVGPSLAQTRDAMHTVISPERWIEASTGQPLGELLPGNHKLRIAMPLIDSPEVEGDKSLRAVSNEIEIQVPEVSGVFKTPEVDDNVSIERETLRIGYAGKEGQAIDIASHTTVGPEFDPLDVTEDWQLSVSPDQWRDWFGEQNKGDFYNDMDCGLGVCPLRGARILNLPVLTWKEAAAISNEMILRDIGKGADGHGGKFFAVLTKENLLAVVETVSIDKSKQFEQVFDIRLRGRVDRDVSAPTEPRVWTAEYRDDKGDAWRGNLVLYSRGFRNDLPLRPSFTNNEGLARVELPAGDWWIVANQSWPVPTITRASPDDEQPIQVAVKPPKPAAWSKQKPELEVAVHVPSDPKAVADSIEVVITNNTNHPYTLSHSDLSLVGLNHWVYCPDQNEQQPRVVPPKGNGDLRVTLDLDEYITRGLWGRVAFSGSWRDLSGVDLRKRFRVKVAQAYSMPFDWDYVTHQVPVAADESAAAPRVSDGPWEDVQTQERSNATGNELDDRTIASVKGLSSRLELVSPQGPIRIGDVLQYNLILKNETDEPINFDWVTGSRWQSAVDEQTRLIMLKGPSPGSERVEQKQVVIPPQREQVIHQVQYRLTREESANASSPFPLKVTPGDYQILAILGPGLSTPRQAVDFYPAARFQFRKEIPEGIEPIGREADRDTWTNANGQEETLALDKEIVLDEDDVEFVLNRVQGLRSTLEIRLNAVGARKMQSATQAAVGHGQRLVLMCDGKVIAAPVIQSVLSERVSVTGLKQEQASLIQKVMAEITNRRTETSSADQPGTWATPVMPAESGSESSSIPGKRTPVVGLSASLKKIAPQGQIRIGDVLHYEVVAKNETGEPIEFFLPNETRWQPVIDETSRLIILSGSTGNGEKDRGSMNRVLDERKVIPPYGEQVIHRIRVPVVATNDIREASKLMLKVTPGEYHVLAKGPVVSTSRQSVDFRSAAQFQVRLTLPDGEQEEETEPVVWRDKDGKSQKLFLNQQIYLDEDDVQAAAKMESDLQLRLTPSGARRLHAITQPAALQLAQSGKGRRLVMVFKGKVVAADLIKTTMSDVVMLSGLTKVQQSELLMCFNAGPPDGGPTVPADGNVAAEQVVAELIISKERGGQISPNGIGYSLDNELITLDKLQGRLQEKLKAVSALRLVIRADPELPFKTVAVAMQHVKAAGVKNISIASDEEDN
ncbi:M56 family metallopeptidase [Rhodopirellula sp. SWK7]|uniref:M56 family metallopeptidase n=1 Tax=Rhodopirellula sp. SWK7 TaxID=595460 RepID=UPI0002BED6BC|nr:M56 family metallopeptidase [Rhodopirellula sp. SWK7]EMI45530.1 membrane protein containing Peptidase M56, BlaR1 domain protein [Rhodopirellula sp. SWK7]